MRVPQRLEVRIGEASARLLDVSHGGFRVEIAGGTVPDSPFVIALNSGSDDKAGRVKARLAWPLALWPSAEHWTCGAEVSLEAPNMTIWKRFVERLELNAS
jgi:hypothetical protein